MESCPEFVNVDINTFFSPEEIEVKNEKTEVFTKKQNELINTLMTALLKSDKEHYDFFINRIKDLERLADTIARFPSLLEHHELSGVTRTRTTLINSLLKHLDDTDRTLRIPSKAVLGRSLLVAKTHTLSNFANCSKYMGNDFSNITKELDDEINKSMFSLLIEDVYLNLISDKLQPIEFRSEWALSLLLLWEHWNDQNIVTLAPVLETVWMARRKLAPAFGTMMGTSELMLISMEMDEEWIKFIKTRMGDDGVSQAMEEFLFGISTEQIQTLRNILKTKGIPAIGRDEVSKFLGEHIKADAGLDYRDFYSIYTIRRDNARSRSRLGVPGPTKTLEDYFVQFITTENKEKQNKDYFAAI